MKVATTTDTTESPLSKKKAVIAVRIIATMVGMTPMIVVDVVDVTLVMIDIIITATLTDSTVLAVVAVALPAFATMVTTGGVLDIPIFRATTTGEKVTEVTLAMVRTVMRTKDGLGEACASH